MFRKIKPYLHTKTWRMGMSAAAVSALACFSAMAVDPTPFNLATVMTTSVQSMVNDIISMMTAVIPIGLTVLAVSVGVSYGRNFIKKIMKA